VTASSKVKLYSFFSWENAKEDNIKKLKTKRYLLIGLIVFDEFIECLKAFFRYNTTQVVFQIFLCNELIRKHFGRKQTLVLYAVNAQKIETGNQFNIHIASVQPHFNSF